MHAQPVVEAVEDCVGILQLRLIPFVSPYVQARRIESGKLRPLLQLPDECLEALVIFRRRGMAGYLFFARYR